MIDRITTLVAEHINDHFGSMIECLAQLANSPSPSDLTTETNKAARIFQSFTDPNSALGIAIPEGVLSKAKGFAIFTICKAGFMWSGRVGSGVVVARLEGEEGNRHPWSSPLCVRIGGIGLGFQMGADVTDFVIVFNTSEAIKAFSHSENITLGGNLSVTAGPLGVGGELSSTLLEPVPLYSYCRSKGLFAGISVQGTIITERKRTNRAFYGKDVTPEEILMGRTDAPADFRNVLVEAISETENSLLQVEI